MARQPGEGKKTGKRETGRPPSPTAAQVRAAAKKGELNLKAGRKRSSKKTAGIGDDRQGELIPIDERRIPEIETAEEARWKAVAAIADAHKEAEAAEALVVTLMLKHGYDPQTNPTYSRVPWGSVVLTQTGEVKTHVKYVGETKKKKKKADQESGADDEE